MNEFAKTIVNGLKSYVQNNIKKARSNWNQNDETAIDYVKNRTHWTEEKYVDIIPETTISNPVVTTEDYNVFALTSEHIKEVPEFTTNTEYTVIWNGTEYKSVAKIVAEVDGIVCLGNDKKIFGTGDTGEPFFIMPDTLNQLGATGEDVLCQIGACDGSTSFTFKVSGLTAIVHKLDKKYLPEIKNIKNILDGSAEGSVRTINSNTEIGDSAFAEGIGSMASGISSHAEGKGTNATGEYSHAEGWYTAATGNNTHAEGANTSASGLNSHAEGYLTKANGPYSHAEGWSAQTMGSGSHAEGFNTIASGSYSHAEGYGGMSIIAPFTITGSANATNYSVSEWSNEIRIGRILKYNEKMSKIISYDNSSLLITLSEPLSSDTLTNAEVIFPNGVACCDATHIEGYATNTFADYSHAEGYRTEAYSNCQHVQGKYNNKDYVGNYAHIVGNGESEDTRSNAHTLDWEGNAWFAGDVYVGGTSQDDATAVSIITELDEIKKSVSDGKTLVAGAITDKGIETAANATFETMASNINSIITLDSVPRFEAATWIPGTEDRIIYAGQYLDGDQTIKGDANLIAENIAKGKNIFGVTGTYEPLTGIDFNINTCGVVNIVDDYGYDVYNGIILPESGNSYMIIEPEQDSSTSSPIFKLLVELPSLKYIVLEHHPSYEISLSDSSGALPDTGILSLDTEYSITGYSINWDFSLESGNQEYSYILRTHRNNTSYGTNITHMGFSIDIEIDY